jgi:uncharacterized protein YndB with AHSA1/START domain
MASAVVTLPSDTEILITRVFDAPRESVWHAYTTPELISKWWPGARGEMKSCEIDPRVGGTWRFAMIASGGHEVAFHGEYREIVEHEKIVFTEVYEGAPGGGAALITVTFAETDGHTTLAMLTQVDNKEIRDMIVGSGMETGVQEGMDILESLAKEAARASG